MHGINRRNTRISASDFEGLLGRPSEPRLTVLRFAFSWSCLLFVFLACLPAALAAEEPQISASLGQDEIYEGQSVVYRVIVDNVENPQDARTPRHGGLRRRFPRPAVARFAPDHDHQRRDERGRPPRPGIPLSSDAQASRASSTIPPPEIKVDGKTLRGEKLRLVVQPPSAQDLAAVELTADRQEVYPTQPFTVTLSVFVKELPRSAVRPRSPVGPEAAARAADSLAHGPGPAGRAVVQGRLANMGQGIHRPGGRGLRPQRPRAAHGLFLLRREQCHRLPAEAADR